MGDIIPPGSLSYLSLKKRQIFAETCKQYTYGVNSSDSTQVATYFTRSGSPVAQKVRDKDKNFHILGDIRKATLFGQHLFGSGGGERVIITEGEIDCLSIAQAFNGKEHVVSVKNGAAAAKKDLMENLEFLENYRSIVLAFDNDEPGQKAFTECAPLFSPGKVFKFNYPPDCKDGNDVLVKHGAAKIVDGIFNAIEWKPDGIYNAQELWDDLNKPNEIGWSYPWPQLTQLTLGIRPTEMIVFGAGTGMGKTEFFKEIEAHLILTHNLRVGTLHLEETRKDTMLGLLTKVMSKPVSRPDVEVDKKGLHEAFKKLTQNDNLFVYDSFGNTDFDEIKGVIRYLVVGKECKVVFLDHLTAMIDGLSEEGKVNQKMRNIMNELASLTRELNFSLFAISHLRKPNGTPHEEGGRVHLDDLYGSSAIKQWASFVFGLERNQQAEDLEERNTTTIRGLKDRKTGQSAGKTLGVRYDKDTGRITEIGAINGEDSF